MKFPVSGLYAITQTEGKTPSRISSEVEAALKGGAAVIQYRNKSRPQNLTLAATLLEICRAYHAPLLINDDPELALAIGADGVHLGRNDGGITEVRRKLGADAIIGVSCYDNVEKAVDMQAKSADYVAFGRFFPSTTKPLATPARIETLKIAKRTLTIPVVAIGGILPENGRQLLAEGADLLAVIGGIFDREPEAAARAYCTLFTTIEEG